MANDKQEELISLKARLQELQVRGAQGAGCWVAPCVSRCPLRSLPRPHGVSPSSCSLPAAPAALFLRLPRWVAAAHAIRMAPIRTVCPAGTKTRARHRARGPADRAACWRARGDGPATRAVRHSECRIEECVASVARVGVARPPIVGAGRTATLVPSCYSYSPCLVSLGHHCGPVPRHRPARRRAAACINYSACRSSIGIWKLVIETKRCGGGWILLYSRVTFVSRCWLSLSVVGSVVVLLLLCW